MLWLQILTRSRPHSNSLTLLLTHTTRLQPGVSVHVVNTQPYHMENGQGWREAMVVICHAKGEGSYSPTYLPGLTPRPRRESNWKRILHLAVFPINWTSEKSHCCHITAFTVKLSLSIHSKPFIHDVYFSTLSLPMPLCCSLPSVCSLAVVTPLKLALYSGCGCPLDNK